MSEMVIRVSHGTTEKMEEKTYKVPVGPGMVVLDAIHYIQSHFAPDLAVRWNCKAAKCGSCSAEVNGKPKLMCKSRMDAYDQNEELVVHPIKTFPRIKDLVTDVSWNYRVNKTITPFTPPKGNFGKMYQADMDRVQEFRKCIECFLCQSVCHVLRNHEKHEEFAGPRFFVRIASLEMHPLDEASRIKFLKEEGGLGYCNITKCCSEVCPEDIHITDNAIIPLKERVVDEYYDPVQKIFRIFSGK
ncbi:MAG: succinate dehydrogenase/fumarate reductase iron-sulfur subunit [Acidobacteria bacterium RIFCSPLOWO2_12_FULL_54_10]|nr:MAG: succinate dehydrogenase/fumarate reductase iron-sulfur subunit [Acidobacteria bacterium RIFCSPLOWO2_12_FULL_54_10]